jgi:hypothetical protein
MMHKYTAIVIGTVMIGIAACGSEPETHEGAVPARVDHPQREADLTTITLTAKAEAELGIRTAGVAYQPLRRTRTVGGEVVIPASLGDAERPAFVLRSPPSAVDRARTGEALVSAEGEAQQARVQVEAATIARERAQRMLRDGVGSARAVDEARAALSLAQAALDQAENRRDVLAGQTFRVPITVWIRVPVYVGDADTIRRDADAVIGGLGAAPGTATRTAQPVAAPPSANPEAATIDLFYRADNADGSLIPGEKVGVTLQLRGEDESLVVPWPAVLHDIHGGEWVYENTAPHTFVRRRVQVRDVTDGMAVLASGPRPGAPVVVEGAAELFGTEFGVGK